MDYSIILRPLIGAGIGYVTNWIAVKMLFRPLNPVKIGKWKLPFTPGIIPRNKNRIAKSIGITVSDKLLSENVISKSLLSKDKENRIKEEIKEKINELSVNDKISIKEKALDLINEDAYNKIIIM